MGTTAASSCRETDKQFRCGGVAYRGIFQGTSGRRLWEHHPRREVSRAFGLSFLPTFGKHGEVKAPCPFEKDHGTLGKTGTSIRKPEDLFSDNTSKMTATMETLN
jgi:hypothetical protein